MALSYEFILGVVVYFTGLFGWAIRIQYSNGERLTKIEAHLKEQNGRIFKSAEKIVILQNAVQMASCVNRALLNDLNERRAEVGRPPVTFETM